MVELKTRMMRLDGDIKMNNYDDGTTRDITVLTTQDSRLLAENAQLKPDQTDVWCDRSRIRSGFGRQPMKSGGVGAAALTKVSNKHNHAKHDQQAKCSTQRFIFQE
jgi:hypothetical protein